MDTKLLPFATQDVPRYTSYPTAVQFQSPFPGQTSDDWLTALDRQATLSVYVHIPFCRQLCWYCGCHTSVPNSYDRAARYVAYLLKDIRRSAALFRGRKGKVTHLHFGGGTPTYLDDFHIIEGEGTVARIVTEGPESGMGVAFTSLSPDNAKILEEVQRRSNRR
jgi:oxygen-independent coproporphyrinogen-3 oxidase